MKSLWPDRFNRAEVQGSLFRNTVESIYLRAKRSMFAVYRGYFPYILLLPGRRILFGVPRTSLRRGSLYRSSTVFLKSRIFLWRNVFRADQT